jgi:hypothetical protein
MQNVAENYIEQFFEEDETGRPRVVITSAFKTRDFADMAAALRMIHETRIKIRKSAAPPEEKEKKRDFISMIREAGLARMKENRKLIPLLPRAPEPDPPPNSEEDLPSDEDSDTENLSRIRARIESEADLLGENSDA